MAASTTKTQIANLALVANLGQTQINNIDEPGTSHNAAVMALFWDDARQFALRAGPWRFALRRETITRETATPAHSWAYQFLIPTRCMLLHQVGEDSYPLEINRDYKVEGGRLISNNEGPLPVVYVDNIEDVAAFPPDFKFAMAAYLAHLAAPDILKSTDKAQEMLKLFEYYMETASTNNALENPPKVINNSKWRNSQRGLRVYR
jgi:hypothetical protein